VQYSKYKFEAVLKKKKTKCTCLRLKRRSNKRLPVFVAAAVLHTGEMAPDFFTCVEWVAPSTMGRPLLRVSRQSFMHASRQRSKRSSQGRLGALLHLRGFLGPSLDKAARGTARLTFN
jgi:hypothetical protein